MTEYEALKKAVEICGGQTQLARELTARTGKPIGQGHVWKWLRRGKRLPEKYALHVEAITENLGDKINASDLCHLAFSSRIA